MFKVKSRGFGRPLFVCAIAGAVSAVLAGVGAQTLAQATLPTSDAAPAVPSVRILKGVPVSLNAAAAFYVDQTATDGLCRDFGPSGVRGAVPELCAGASRPRAPEIVELARALRGDPDLIYEYVRNRSDTEFLFGSHKGALGTSIDAAGTAFDQASLLVELLRQSGYAANYKYGQVTLTGAQFYDWTGFNQARAACDFLASGGIPASVNGTAGGTCNLSGQVSSVVIAHVWVEAQIEGVNVFMDPSIKTYEHIETLTSLRTDIGFSEGTAGGSGRQGAQQGVSNSQSYVSNLNDVGLGDALNANAASLLQRIKATPTAGQRDLRGGDIWDVVGGRRLQVADRPEGGWRQFQPANYSLLHTWTAIPDVFRARMVLGADRPWGTGRAVVFDNLSFFVDEIYGRRLEVGSAQKPCSSQPDPGCSFAAYAPVISLDSVLLVQSASLSDLALVQIDLELRADHPFAASSGGYADAVVKKKVDFLAPMTIVHGWGDTSSELANKWSREQGVDRPKSPTQQFSEESAQSAFATDGDLVRARVAATWLAQSSRARNIHGELAGSRATHYHSLGVVSTDQKRNTFPKGYAVEPGQMVPEPLKGFATATEAIVVDIETTFSLVSRTSDAVNRRAALHAIAATSATLEGSVLEQLTMTPDAASSARRLAWGNRPEVGETPDTASRRVYRYQTSDRATIMSTLVAENLATGIHGEFTPSGGPKQEPLPADAPDRLKGRLAATVSDYVAQGYDVTASGEAMLGPGHRHGPEVLDHIAYQQPGSWGDDGPPTYVFKRLESLQVGGAIIANHYDADGDPDFIAHTLTRTGKISKGAASEAGDPGTFDPSKAAERLKDNWVNRSGALGVNLSSGEVGYSSPVLQSIGQGDFPYKLDAKAELRGRGIGLIPLENSHYPNYGVDGVVTNWEAAASFGSSAMAGMGDARIEAVAQTVTAFVHMQDIWREAPSATREMIGSLIANWWADTIVHNTMTITAGSNAEQYTRVATGDYLASSGGGRVEITGRPRAERAYSYSLGFPQGRQREEATRSWNMDGVVVRVVGHEGDVRTFATIGIEPTAESHISKGPTVRKQWNFRLAEWSFPSGVKLNLTYPQSDRGMTPTAVVSNLGYTLSLPSISNSIAGPTGEAMVVQAVDASGGVSRAAFRGKVDRSSTQRPVGALQLEAIYAPSSAATPQVKYVYDSAGRVKEARDAIAIATPAARGAHQFFVAEGYRGERQDPLGGRYAVETLNDGRLQRHTDEMGRVSTGTYDGRKRLLSRTSSWGDVTTFKYDDRDNIVEKIQTPKAGCGIDAWWCQTITVKAEYHPTWNKPTKIILPATIGGLAQSEWTFSYNAQGLVQEVRSPLVFDARNNQNAQAVTRSWYDGFGRVTKTQDPTGVETSQVWGGGGLPAYCLRQSIVSSQSGGLSLTTAYECNSTGDVTGVTDPRGHRTSFDYDALRRKTREIGPSSTGVQTRWIYDLDGNVLEEMRRHAQADAWRTTVTTYSATGKPLTVTDPSGDVSRICYDALDRAVVAVDPTGRATRTSYNAASQPTHVERWFTANVGDAACALTNARPEGINTNTWRKHEYNAAGLQSAEIDANGNRTQMTYDGLGRLIVTTFADDAEAWSITDQRGQAVITKTRGGDYRDAYFDQLGRIHHVWEHDAGAPYLKGRNTRTGYDLAGRPVWKDVSTQPTEAWDESLRRDVHIYGYDVAGRATTDQVQPMDAAIGSASKTLTYGYDAAGNRTSITWPDGFEATYAFDAANRPQTVGFGGHTATIAHDSLSRRTSVARSSGANTVYAYEPDGDLLSLTHNWAAAAAGQTAGGWTYIHDAAGRLTETEVSRLDLEWLPTTAYARAYGPANNLNQVASQAGQALTFNANGNLSTFQGATYTWALGNRLAGVSRPGMTASYAYDGEDRRTMKVVDGVTTRTLWSGADEVAEMDEAGNILRRFIPDGSGAMDGRLASLEANGTIYWHHTDHQGSVVATSNAAGAPVSLVNYSPNGELGTAIDGTPLTGPPTGSPFGYTGRQYDPETGLWQYRARYYHPQLGQFLSHDPIGTKDDPNLYMYVGNDPVNRTDPTGECDVVCRRAISVAATRAGGRYVTSAIVSQVDSPLPGPADAVAAVGAVVTTGALIWDIGNAVFNDAASPDVPDGIVGANPRETRGRTNSDGLAEENGGTGDAEKDFDGLTGGVSGPASEGSRYPEGTRVGENGIAIRPGTDKSGPRIDIPAKGEKPHETLHYPKSEY